MEHAEGLLSSLQKSLPNSCSLWARPRHTLCPPGISNDFSMGPKVVLSISSCPQPTPLATTHGEGRWQTKCERTSSQRRDRPAKDLYVKTQPLPSEVSWPSWLWLLFFIFLFKFNFIFPNPALITLNPGAHGRGKAQAIQNNPNNPPRDNTSTCAILLLRWAAPGCVPWSKQISSLIPHEGSSWAWLQPGRELLPGRKRQEQIRKKPQALHPALQRA